MVRRQLLSARDRAATWLGRLTRASPTHLVLRTVVALCILTLAACSDDGSGTSEPSQSATSATYAPPSAAALDESDSADVCPFLERVEGVAGSTESIDDAVAQLEDLAPELSDLVESTSEQTSELLDVIAGAVSESVTTRSLDPLVSDDVADAGAQLSKAC